MQMVKITALEGEHKGDALEAPYDTNRLVVTRGNVWQRQPNKGPGDLEFERVEAAHVSLALLWERMSTGMVQPHLDLLLRLAEVDAVLHRPPRVEVTWGAGADAIPKFDGVIESLSIRYAGVSDAGEPLHAAVDVRLAQAVHLKTKP